MSGTIKSGCIAALGYSGRCAVQEIKPVRTAINKAPGIGLSVITSREVSEVVRGINLRAAQRVIRLRPNAEHQRPAHTRLSARNRWQLNNDAIVVDRKKCDWIHYLLRQACRNPETSRGWTLIINTGWTTAAAVLRK